MGSARRYWNTSDLLSDFRYWRNAYPLYNRERANASLIFLCARWGMKGSTDIDRFVMRQIEGRKDDGGNDNLPS